jgi:hypothetical protein
VTFGLHLVTDPLRCATGLRPGEIKRCPLDLTHPPITYYVACPACGSLNVVPVSGGKRAVTGDGGPLTLAPGFVCWGDSCRRQVEIVSGAFEVADAAA